MNDHDEVAWVEDETLPPWHKTFHTTMLDAHRTYTCPHCLKQIGPTRPRPAENEWPRGEWAKVRIVRKHGVPELWINGVPVLTRGVNVEFEKGLITVRVGLAVQPDDLVIE